MLPLRSGPVRLPQGRGCWPLACAAAARPPRVRAQQGPAVQVITFFLLFVGGLWAYHVYLALTNQTTYEASFRDRVPYLKDVPEATWPFSHGLAGNLHSFCCASGPQKYTLSGYARSASAASERPGRARAWLCCVAAGVL